MEDVIRLGATAMMIGDDPPDRHAIFLIVSPWTFLGAVRTSAFMHIVVALMGDVAVRMVDRARTGEFVIPKRRFALDGAARPVLEPQPFFQPPVVAAFTPLAAICVVGDPQAMFLIVEIFALVHVIFSSVVLQRPSCIEHFIL